MATLYSERLFVAHMIGDEILTAPSDAVLIIRTITVFSSGADLGVTAQLIDVETSATLWWVKFQTNVGGVYQNDPDLRIVVPSGSQIQVVAEAPCDVGLFGYRLTLP